MNAIKYFLYTITLIVSHNALGMMGFGHALTTPKASQHGNFELLGTLYVRPENQNNFFDYINTDNTNDPKFQIMLENAQLVQQLKALEKENPVITNLKNSEYTTTNSYYAQKTDVRPKKLYIKISNNGYPTKVLSERNK